MEKLSYEGNTLHVCDHCGTTTVPYTEGVNQWLDWIGIEAKRVSINGSTVLVDGRLDFCTVECVHSYFANKTKWWLCNNKKD